MKKTGISLFIVIVIALITTTSFDSRQDLNSNENTFQDTAIKYRDGTYEGLSQHIYTNEPYWGKVRIIIDKGMLTGINFIIRDSNLHETFSKKYKKHFKGNMEYIQQVLNDWKGVKTYPKKLIDSQNINKIDALSGATWSYNIFKASAGEALKKAELK
jgi:major membrane immunogen (membrane-anchored lipoprotein)